jgi:hypothetical protein
MSKRASGIAYGLTTVKGIFGAKENPIN